MIPGMFVFVPRTSSTRTLRRALRGSYLLVVVHNRSRNDGKADSSSKPPIRLISPFTKDTILKERLTVHSKLVRIESWFLSQMSPLIRTAVRISIVRN